MGFCIIFISVSQLLSFLYVGSAINTAGTLCRRLSYKFSHVSRGFDSNGMARIVWYVDGAVRR